MTAANKTSSARAFTLLEAILVITFLCIIAVIILPARPRRGSASRIMCMSNQKQVALAFQQWAFDHNSQFPMQESLTNGGTMELVSLGLVAPHFQTLSNELKNAQFLHCPSDKQRTVTYSFNSNLNQTTVSFFVGVDGTTNEPSAFLLGDDNLSLNDTSPPPSRLLTLTSNSSVSWTDKRHKKQGNVALFDGSVQGFTPTRLREALRNTGLQTNRLILP